MIRKPQETDDLGISAVKNIEMKPLFSLHQGIATENHDLRVEVFACPRSAAQPRSQNLRHASHHVLGFKSE
jgi:hypothetical protein